MGGPRADLRPDGAGDRSAQERILDALPGVVDEVGYAHLTVERVIAVAELSRATFYQYFTNVEDCFWAAYQHHSQEVCATVAAATRHAERPCLAALEALVTLAQRRPAVAGLLTREALAAGPSGLLERDALIAGLEAALEGAERPLEIDLPPGILIGGVFRFLAMRHAGAAGGAGLRLRLREWAAAFPARRSGASWSGRLTPFACSRMDPATAGAAAPRGVGRERILYGTALAIRAKGYHAVTVSDIAAAAGVSRRRFYNDFPSKEHAFLAVYEDGFERAMAACAPAFFSGGSWRECVWQAGLAFTGFMAREPLVAHIGFLECHAIGPRHTPRVHDTQLAFTLFLEQGYRERPEAQALSRELSSLVAATIFEVAFQASCRGPAFELRRCQPLAVYVALAPFIGVEDAGEFVLGKLAGAPGASRVAA